MMLKDLPSNESIRMRIKERRESSNRSQADVAFAVNEGRSWVEQIERGGIDPIYFFNPFVKLYGKKEAVSVYGEDWSLYTGERVALYYAYYDINRKESCSELGISYTALRYLLGIPDKIIVKYKDGIDRLFPRIHEDDLSHYHLIGNNSMCYIEDGCAMILLNANSNYRHKDSQDNYKDIMAEAREFVIFHDRCDCLPSGSYEIPASKMSYWGFS